jgi:diketogulonate reductase-like aldo/keto reductase
LKITDKLFLATKVWTQGKDKGVEQMEQSLQRLKRDKLDLMQVHNLTDWQTQLADAAGVEIAGTVSLHRRDASRREAIRRVGEDPAQREG